MMSTKNCSICGEEISSEAEICPKCGVRPAGLVVQSDVSKLYWPQDRINPSIGNWL